MRHDRCATAAYCSSCGAEIKAFFEINEKEGVFLHKECPRCKRAIRLIDRETVLYKRLYCNSKKEQSFVNLTLPITYRCNLACPLCYAGRYQKEDESLDTVKRLIDQSGESWIKVTGGEPTMRDDLPDILNYLAKKNRRFTLVTNGIRLADRKYLRKLKKAGLYRVSLSFAGFDNAIYMKLRGKPLAKLKRRALHNLKAEEIEVVLSVSIVRNLNENQLASIYAYYIKNNSWVHSLRVRSLTRTGSYIDVKPFCISEMISIIAKAIGIPSQYVAVASRMRQPYSSSICRICFRPYHAWCFLWRDKTLSLWQRLYYTAKIFRLRAPYFFRNNFIHVRVWPDTETFVQEHRLSCMTCVIDDQGTSQSFCEYYIQKERSFLRG